MSTETLSSSEDSSSTDDTGKHRMRRVLEALAGPLAITVITCIVFWRTTGTLGSTTWTSDLQDGASFTWNFWYFPDALFNGENPFRTDQIFHPLGANLGFHTYMPLISLLTWPFVKVFGISTTFGLVNLFGAAASGIGAFYLARYLVHNGWAALFAGVAYALLPDRALRMNGHLNLNQTEVLPFALLALFAFYDQPTKKRAALLGAAMGVSLMVEAIYTAFLLIAIVVFALVRFRRTITRAVMKGWALAIAVGAVIASPALVALISELRSGKLDPIPRWGEADKNSADLISYLVPSEFHPVWGDLFAPLYSRFTSGERFAFVGWSVIALALLGVVFWRHRYRWPLAALAGTFFVLSLGPFLHVFGKAGSWFNYYDTGFGLPLPFFVFHQIPILNGVRIPGRFMFMTGLLLAILAAAGLAWLIKRLGGERRFVAPVLALAFTAFFIVESLPGSIPKTTSSAVPAAYSVLAKQPGDAAVLELPLQWRDGFDRIGDTKAQRDDTVFLYYATKHEKPISGGMTARYPNVDEKRLQEIPVYAQILGLQNDIENSPPATFNAADLQALDIGWVAIHRDRPTGAADYVRRLQLPVLADDGNTTIYRVS